MTIPSEVRGKFYALRAAALAVGLAGIAAIVLRGQDFGFLFLGLLGIVVGTWLVRRSNAMVWRARGQVVAEWSPAKASKRVGPLAWTLTAMSLAACVIFSLAVYVDQLHGGKQVWPVYALFVAVLALAVTSGYVAMRIFQ